MEDITQTQARQESGWTPSTFKYFLFTSNSADVFVLVLLHPNLKNRQKHRLEGLASHVPSYR